MLLSFGLFFEAFKLLFNVFYILQVSGIISVLYSRLSEGWVFTFWYKIFCCIGSVILLLGNLICLPNCFAKNDIEFEIEMKLQFISCTSI